MQIPSSAWSRFSISAESRLPLSRRKLQPDQYGKQAMLNKAPLYRLVAEDRVPPRGAHEHESTRGMPINGDQMKEYLKCKLVD